MADNLESYFKKHLSDETPGEGNWNVPSDDVWNKALPEIQKKRGLFIPWKYLYIIGVLVIAGLAIIFWPSGTTDTPVGLEILSLTESASVLDRFDGSEGSNGSSGSNDLADSSSSNSSLVSNASDDVGGTDGFDETNSSLGSNGSLVPFSSEAFEVQEDVLISKLTPLRINSIEIPYFLALSEIETLTKEAIVLDDLKPQPQPQPVAYSNKGKIGVGAYFAPTYNSTYVSGDLSTGKVETGNMFLYSGNWGAELKYFISHRLVLVGGMERSEIKSWSRSLIDFEYDASTEHTMPGGEKENTSPIPMQTPFGAVDTEITYRFPGDQEISDGELMLSAMETHQEIRYLSIPIGVEYNFINFSKFNWFGEGGLRFNHALKDATEYTSRILHGGHDMDVVNEITTGQPSYTENYLGFNVGTGINYQLSETIQISGSARYFGNITKVNFQENLSTYVHGFSLKLGILYIF